MANGQNLLCEKVKITSNFWNRYRKLVAETVIPYQYNTLNDNIDVKLNKDAFADMRFYDGKIKSHAIENLKIAAGITQGKHSGMNFQDTDVYKWLEAAAYTLKYYPNQDLQKKTDDIVELIGQAQEEDGYLSTIFQINMPKRKFKRLQQSHELYSMGHYIEAGVAYSTASFLFMEMQWISSPTIHSGEFFHGPFELALKDTPYLLFMSDGNTRHLDARAMAFLQRFDTKLTVIDAKDHGLASIASSNVIDYFNPMLITGVTRVYAEKLAEARQHPLTQRRYMWKLENY